MKKISLKGNLRPCQTCAPGGRPFCPALATALFSIQLVIIFVIGTDHKNGQFLRLITTIDRDHSLKLTFSWSLSWLAAKKSWSITTFIILLRSRSCLYKSIKPVVDDRIERTTTWQRATNIRILPRDCRRCCCCGACGSRPWWGVSLSGTKSLPSLESSGQGSSSGSSPTTE